MTSNIVSGYVDTADDSSFQGNGVAWKTSGANTGLPATGVWVNCTHTDSNGTTWSQW